MDKHTPFTDITQTIIAVENHKHVKWLHKFVPIYLFHFLFTLNT